MFPRKQKWANSEMIRTKGKHMATITQLASKNINTTQAQTHGSVYGERDNKLCRSHLCKLFIRSAQMTNRIIINLV